MKNSKIKGSGFERDLAKKFSLWITNGVDAYAVSRDSSSGGALRHKSGFTEQSGDIVAIKETAMPFFSKVSIEAKHYKDLKMDLWNLVAGKTSRLEDFLQQTLSDAEIYNKKFILVLKSNNIEPIIITDLEMQWTARIHYIHETYNINTLKYLLSTDADKLINSLR